MNAKHKRTEQNRQFDCRNRTIERINQVFYSAINEHLTHEQILKRLYSQDGPYNDEYKRRLTIAQKEYARGYMDCKFDQIWSEHISWGFKPLGVFCATFEEVQEKFPNEIVADKCNGFHYWTKSNGEHSFT